jgi:hypothetical protein
VQSLNHFNDVMFTGMARYISILLLPVIICISIGLFWLPALIIALFILAAILVPLIVWIIVILVLLFVYAITGEL